MFSLEMKNIEEMAYLVTFLKTTCLVPIFIHEEHTTVCVRI